MSKLLEIIFPKNSYVGDKFRKIDQRQICSIPEDTWNKLMQISNPSKLHQTLREVRIPDQLGRPQSLCDAAIEGVQQAWDLKH